ncbi:MAG: DUF1804 family protein [Magnetococcales bacterium]|nr:DUF1804 family protein [Magnetococcales bacterium]
MADLGVAMQEEGRNRGWDQLAEALWGEYLQSHQEAMLAIKEEVTDPLQRVEALSKLSLALDRTFRALDRGGTGCSPLLIARLVLERQAEFIKLRFPAHLPAFLEILEPFGQLLLADGAFQA